MVDCSHGSAGPRMTGMLADLGADVIWVERPGGDPFRRYAPAASSVFNRNKRSVECDLKSDAGRQAVSRLLVDADLFVESWRPGVADSFDLGWMTLHERIPSLSLFNFGLWLRQPVAGRSRF